MLRTLHAYIWKSDNSGIFAEKIVTIGNISSIMMAVYGPVQI